LSQVLEDNVVFRPVSNHRSIYIARVVLTRTVIFAFGLRALNASSAVISRDNVLNVLVLLECLVHFEFTVTKVLVHGLAVLFRRVSQGP
jgi:hypothetical protein